VLDLGHFPQAVLIFQYIAWPDINAADFHNKSFLIHIALMVKSGLAARLYTVKA
jgi:hypothetical protein